MTRRSSNDHAGLRQPLAERRLVADPRAFRQSCSISDGMEAVAWEFRQAEKLSADFTRQLWAALLRDDDASKVLMRFLQLPLGKKRMFVRALDAHLSERYPMFAGLAANWPAGTPFLPGNARRKRAARLRARQQGLFITWTWATPAATSSCSSGWRRCGGVLKR